MTDFDELHHEQQKVMGILSPYLSRLDAAMNVAIDLFNSETTPLARAEYDDRAATSAIHCHAWSALITEFSEDEGFHFLSLSGSLKVLNIRDELVVRVKKVDANGKHRNAQTKQQKDFDAQLPISGLPDPALRVVLGYQPDLVYSTVERLTVKAPNSTWVSQIVELDEAHDWADITPAQLPLTAGRAKQA